VRPPSQMGPTTERSATDESLAPIGSGRLKSRRLTATGCGRSSVQAGSEDVVDRVEQIAVLD
jgi:hypothetical protein